jgi:anthranilate synthase component 1
MNLSPGQTEFTQTHDAGRPQVVWTTLVGDLETPVSAMLKLSASRPLSFLLESVEGGATRARYSIIGLSPDIIFRARGDSAEINRNAVVDRTEFAPCPGAALDALRALITESRIDLPEILPPMASGVFGYMSYDTVRLMERLPEPNTDVLGLPDILMVRPTVIVIFDNVRDEITVVTAVWPDTSVPARAAFEAAQLRLESVVSDLEKPLAAGQIAGDPDAATGDPVSNTSPERYREMVAQAKDYITAGDIFQVVLSQRFEAPFSLPPFALYRALRRVNPAPFLFYLDYEDFAVVGSSPEILVRVRDGEVTVRPIAGTRPRGETPLEDAHNAADLLSDPKELAEHLMLLDLGRNDAGRVSRIGTVEVTNQFFIEYYSQVMHIVSNVIGRLRDDLDAIHALSAGFPAGTVSGAPKVRAMEIIDELEHEKRGIYAGAIGYFSADGQMDTCIVLRTSIIKDGTMYVQAGAGIVADSVPQSELDECVNKAKALFRAAREAVRFAAQAQRGQ